MSYKDKSPEEIGKLLTSYRENYEKSFSVPVDKFELISRFQIEIQKKQEAFFQQNFGDWSVKSLIEAMAVLSPPPKLEPQPQKKKGKG